MVWLLMHLFLLCTDTVMSEMRFLALGDWGASLDKNDSRLNQQRVADGMDAYAQVNPADFILGLGDNFYPNGVTGVDDTRWQVSWSDVYTGDAIKDLVWYSVLGNHDHILPYMGEVNYSYVNPQWHMPDAIYDEFITKDNITVHFVFLDSESLEEEFSYPRDYQVEWFNQTLYQASQRPTPPDWTFVVAHFNLATCGPNSPGDFFTRQLIFPIMEDYNVALYINGHDHNQQHMSMINGTRNTDVVVAGSGGQSNYEMSVIECALMDERGWQPEYFSTVDGFAAVTVEKDWLQVEWYGGFPNETITLQHSFSKDRRP